MAPYSLPEQSICCRRRALANLSRGNKIRSDVVCAFDSEDPPLIADPNETVIRKIIAKRDFWISQASKGKNKDLTKSAFHHFVPKSIREDTIG